MNDDPVVAFVRKIRDELAAAFDDDVHAFTETDSKAPLNRIDA